ncbi:MAG: hypothetical protein INQ03_00180 [Candidatus Heimdallarchaeota archaeon]|nr:hypothetical protein [Candidatus Heimdallarchaeota archaeon]
MNPGMSTFETYWTDLCENLLDTRQDYQSSLFNLYKDFKSDILRITGSMDDVKGLLTLITIEIVKRIISEKLEYLPEIYLRGERSFNWASDEVILSRAEIPTSMMNRAITFRNEPAPQPTFQLQQLNKPLSLIFEIIENINKQELIDFFQGYWRLLGDDFEENDYALLYIIYPEKLDENLLEVVHGYLNMEFRNKVYFITPFDEDVPQVNIEALLEDYINKIDLEPELICINCDDEFERKDMLLHKTEGLIEYMCKDCAKYHEEWCTECFS